MAASSCWASSVFLEPSACLHSAGRGLTVSRGEDSLPHRAASPVIEVTRLHSEIFMENTHMQLPLAFLH